MHLETRFFGNLEIDESKVIFFQEGIPGFEHLKKFLFMLDEVEDSPFCWLQSIEDIDIVFTLFDVFKYIKDYNPMVEEEFITSIGDFKKGDLLIYTIANITKDIKKISINLKAPIIINMESNKAKQIISTNDDYPIKYYIYEDIKNGGE